MKQDQRLAQLKEDYPSRTIKSKRFTFPNVITLPSNLELIVEDKSEIFKIEQIVHTDLSPEFKHPHSQLYLKKSLIEVPSSRETYQQILATYEKVLNF